MFVRPSAHTARGRPISFKAALGAHRLYSQEAALREIIHPMDTLGIEPRASRMLSGCDTTTPCAHVMPRYLVFPMLALLNHVCQGSVTEACRRLAMATCGNVRLSVHRCSASKCFMGTWCSGITSALHAEGPGFNPQCVQTFLATDAAFVGHSNTFYIGSLLGNSSRHAATHESLYRPVPHGNAIGAQRQRRSASH